jgi:hypothetical protein
VALDAFRIKNRFDVLRKLDVAFGGRGQLGNIEVLAPAAQSGDNPGQQQEGDGST